MDISLLTSLYQAEAHLSSYCQHVQIVAQQVASAGIQLEVVIVANDATPIEQEQLQSLQTFAQEPGTVSIHVKHVPLEPIAQSWNRALRASNAPIFGFWNVDDVRTADAIIEGVRYIQNNDVTLIDFPYDRVVHTQWLGFISLTQRIRERNHFNHHTLTPRIVLGTFFLATKTLVEEIGLFDEHFRVAQDFEWTARAMGVAKYQTIDAFAGEFIVHGGNLSNIGRPIEAVEVNVVLMRNGVWEHVRPTADPELMRRSWETFGDNGVEVPVDVQAILWGERAEEAYENWYRAYQQRLRADAIRRPFRNMVNRLGIRPQLAKLGIVKQRP